jgi:flagellar biosynthesis GTPase FlhF
MTDSLSDDARLRATEAQMRRALGLHNTSPTQAVPIPPPASLGGSYPQRRRFVRDGEVPVSVIQRDRVDAAGTNKLDATRQALSEQVVAREHAEHLLQEAERTIRDLQTNLAHERLARDEVIQRADGEKQIVELALQRMQEELAVERACRQQAEQKRDDAFAARQEAEERLREVLATLDALKVSQAPPRSTHDPQTTRRPWKTMPTTEPPVNGDKVQQQRRRGRSAKSDQSEAEIVEWWKPGWQKQFR